MSAYLARLKQIENEKVSHYIPDTLPPKPPKVPFDPFGGTHPVHIEKKIIVDVEIIALPEPSEIAKPETLLDRQREAQQPATELKRLVRLCGEFYGFTEAEHVEALAVALADFDSAMLCFTTMRGEI